MNGSATLGVLGASLTLTMMGCSSGHAPLASGEPAVTTAIHLDGSHASIEVLIDGHPARMLLDTGSDQNVLTVEAAARLQLVLSEESVPGAGAGGAVTARWARIDDLAVGRARQRQQVAFVMPFPAEFKYDGVLGTPFFQAFVTTIDYQQSSLTLQQPLSFVPPSGLEPVAVEATRGKLLVTATAAGVVGQYSVDTGARSSLTFFTPAVDRHGLRTALSPAIRMITGVGAGGYMHGDLVRVPELVIGPHVLRQVVTELSVEQAGFFANQIDIGNLGAEVWRRFTVTLDYAGGRMYLRPNDSFDQPFIPPRSGLVAGIDSGLIVVKEVTADSPAAEAGAQAGDAVIAVDGKSLATDAASIQSSLALLGGLLRQSPGTQVVLRLRGSDSTERDALLTLRDLL